jgi:hypothetical protein
MSARALTTSREGSSTSCCMGEYSSCGIIRSWRYRVRRRREPHSPIGVMPDSVYQSSFWKQTYWFHNLLSIFKTMLWNSLIWSFNKLCTHLELRTNWWPIQWGEWKRYKQSNNGHSETLPIHMHKGQYFSVIMCLRQINAWQVSGFLFF